MPFIEIMTNADFGLKWHLIAIILDSVWALLKVSIDFVLLLRHIYINILE